MKKILSDDQTPKSSSRIVYDKALTIDEVAHAYTWDGKFVPGVTSILKVLDKPALMGWAIKVTRDYWLEAVKSGRTDFAAIHKESWTAGKKISKGAADIGKNVHQYAEHYLKNIPLPVLLTDEAKLSADAFHKWFDSHNIKILASELLLFSKEHHYAGTCDFIAEVNGVLTVGDFKTSSGIYHDMRFQTAAYQHAFQEERGITVPQRIIARFDKKTGEFEAKTFQNFELDFAGFEAALRLHRTIQTMAG